MLMIIPILSLMFMLMVHPLWMSLCLFFMSMALALNKFLTNESKDLFIYLFLMVYTGGLLILLMFVSSLIPNYNLTNKLPLMLSACLSIFVLYSVYTESYFSAQMNYTYNKPSMSVNYYLMTNYESFYMFMGLLLFSFCFLSVLLNIFKYPLRSL